jgi:hypothetical protein
MTRMVWSNTEGGTKLCGIVHQGGVTSVFDLSAAAQSR